jgi:hypothetical protein
MQQIILGGAFTALDGLFNRQCPVPVAVAAAVCCCLCTLAASDIVTRHLHNPLFKRGRLFMLQAMTAPERKS